jgi:hypothetical protein
MHKKEELIKLTPELVKLIVKTIKYSKGGLDKTERRELGEDLTGTCLSASWRLDRRSRIIYHFSTLTKYGVALSLSA